MAAWQLTADVASRSLNSSAAPGEIPALKRVVLANLSAPKVSTTDDVSMLSFEKATLTATGSEAFEKFYKPGEQLAPISVALADEESTLPPATGGSNDGSNDGSAGGSTGGMTPPAARTCHADSRGDSC